MFRKWWNCICIFIKKQRRKGEIYYEKRWKNQIDSSRNRCTGWYCTVSGSDPTETGTQTTEAEPNAAISETEEPNTDVLDDNTVPAENEPADDTADTEPSLTMGQKMP